MIHRDKSPYECQQDIARHLITHTRPYSRGLWQSREMPVKAYEMDTVILQFDVPGDQKAWQQLCQPDLPWAEQHFKERVSGIPLNPAPSYIDWPWHSAKYREEFVSSGQFDHTYPERYWPKQANGDMEGIRFSYGDLSDVINLLNKHPFSRQAYLPVFFPEDTGATDGQRIPCSLGYHFIRNGAQLDIKYYLRSCDLTRHFLNDVYMTGRLLQYVCQFLGDTYPYTGTMTVDISNLHLFEPDAERYFT